MPQKPKPGRTNQLLRTRKELLLAATSLIKEGRKPTMDEVADKALVSRATVYRHFANVESLLVEAPLDHATPDSAQIFDGDTETNPEKRLDKAEAAMHEMVYKNEAQLRLMLAHSLHPQTRGRVKQPAPVRQNRRTTLIEAALAPTRDKFSKHSYQKLCRALALVFGPESMVVFRDVLPVSEQAAREVKSWMIRSLVQAALRESKKEI